MNQEIGERIRELRESQCYSRERFAEMADISPKFLYDLEKGNKGCSAEVIYRIAKALSVSVEYLMAGESAIQRETVELICVLEKIEPNKKRQMRELLELMNSMCELL